MNYKHLLKAHDCDAFFIEVMCRPITMDTAVCVSPYNTQTGDWITGMNLITSMEDIIKQKVRLVCKDDDKELMDFLNANLKYGVNKERI